MVEIKQNLVDSNKIKMKCPYSMTAEYITVHNTANDASAQQEISYMKSNDKQTSFHYAIDDKEIVQGILENRNGWHAGDGLNGDGNRKSIGIEICYSKSGGDRFIQAEKNTAEFIAMKLQEKNWGIDRVKKHQDWSGKYCPHRTLDMGWERFLNMIKSYMTKYVLHTFGKDKNNRTLTKVYNNQKKEYCTKGWYEINDKYYYVGDDGYLLMEWQYNVDGRSKVYFIAPDWHLHAGWLGFGNTKYFMKSNGDISTGLQTINGDNYYFDSKGVMKTGWQEIDGKKYWFDATTGKMLKGLITFGSEWYYLSHTDGHLMTTDKNGKLV